MNDTSESTNSFYWKNVADYTKNFSLKTKINEEGLLELEHDELKYVIEHKDFFWEELVKVSIEILTSSVKFNKKYTDISCFSRDLIDDNLGSV